ncbi:hypothetical protein [Leptolyngbya sp. FACHB-711]|uniref:hypothetical protein n=1 Tax=unclassified Leptolyngbya TaxID=2650499 RepID=UPI00168627DE|nr:hypothetical protein [Leptolyngbya sp. FACHB-711]MBD1850272.1 hypothetical protein [Cyanobacteria bacterium FACHB-502]MBD2027581.1 hypothetical protein [Leptolyngbya sp. FACHB-711]
MTKQATREYGAAAIGSIVGTFLFSAIGFGIVRAGLGLLASWLSFGLEVVLPAALLVGLCSWVGVVCGSWFGLKRVNAALIGQTIYIQAGLVVLCYAALIALQVASQGQANLLVAWTVLVALSALVSRGIAIWVDTKKLRSKRQ